MGRKWPVVVFATACLVAAAVVAWWPQDDVTVRIETADAKGICVRNLASQHEQCLTYTPEFPSEAKYRVGECLRFVWVYRSDVPPHATRVTCPGA